MNTLSMADGIDNKGGKVNVLSGGSNSMGIPAGQAPGIGSGHKGNSMNELSPNAKVIKPAASNLMTGTSSNRGSGR